MLCLTISRFLHMAVASVTLLTEESNNEVVIRSDMSVFMYSCINMVYIKL